jgi:sortase A
VPRPPVDVVGKTNQELGLPRIEFEWPPKRPAEPERPPKEPFLRYGWRSVIGAIGRLFISLGMLLFGFVGYQLWGTGLQTAASQKALAKEFASKQRAPLPRPTTTVTVAPATTVAPVGGSAAPTAVATTTTTTQPLPEPLDIPEVDAVFAQLAIPRINMKANNILSGVSVDDLRKGVGHFRNTPLPGQKGNVALAGHRTTYGGPFLHIDQMQTGDPITFTNLLGEVYVYKVTSQTVVAPDDTSVLQPTDSPTLTLVTCTPVGTSTDRLIIKADLDIAASGPLRDPTPPAAGKPEPLPAEEPTTVPTTLVPVTTLAGSPSTLAPSTTVAATTTTAIRAVEGEEDLNGAFIKGWFSDKHAIPQMALWGAICGAIGLGAWLISRRLHRNMIGFLIGIFPFLIALYFFYENANLLLPPGL